MRSIEDGKFHPDIESGIPFGRLTLGGGEREGSQTGAIWGPQFEGYGDYTEATRFPRAALPFRLRSSWTSRTNNQDCTRAMLRASQPRRRLLGISMLPFHGLFVTRNIHYFEPVWQDSAE